jgi:hypothetical protein
MLFTYLRFAAVPLAITTTLLISNAARAFTIDTQGSSNEGGNTRFVDPDEQIQNFGRGGSLFGQSGPSVQFGAPAPVDSNQGGVNSVPLRFGPRPLSSEDKD